MEIERKYLIKKENIPFLLSGYPCHHIEQGYLCTDPVIRIRKNNEDYILTCKSKGLMVREEYNLTLTPESYRHLKEKTDGRLIRKDRYVIPLLDGYPQASSSLSASDQESVPEYYAELLIELDFFKADLEGLILAEVEFPDEEAANQFTPPFWFGEDVTYSSRYHNSTLSSASL